MNNSYKIIGVMSGTSLDGIDLVYTHLKFTTSWKFSILEAETIPYTQEWIAILQQLIFLSPQELDEVDMRYTQFLVQKINAFIQKYGLLEIDAICSHGHTAVHKPYEGITMQIGNKPILAKLLQQTIVCDFRKQDVALGGQGAPLVPIGDALLFNEYDFCLNLGGFANVSTCINSKRIAFDVCPVNVVLNYYANKLGKIYDADGLLARSGRLNHDLLKDLNKLTYYTQKPPKSLGIEWVNETVFPLLDKHHDTPLNYLHTFTEHIAVQLKNVLNSNTTVLLTGGGAYNNFLIERLATHTTCKLVIPDTKIIEFKEALIFALLGVLKLRGEINCLSSVTGAIKDHSSGVIYQP